MLIGYAGPGWEWPSKADVFGRSDCAAKQSEVRRSHGVNDRSNRATDDRRNGAT
jgi:hypothetical protein